MEMTYEGPSEAQIREFFDLYGLDRKAEEMFRQQAPAAQMVAIHNFRPTSTTKNMHGRFAAFVRAVRESGYTWTEEEARRESLKAEKDDPDDEAAVARVWIQFHTFEGRAWWWCKKEEASDEEFFFEDDISSGWRRFIDKNGRLVEGRDLVVNRDPSTRFWWWNANTREWFWEPPEEGRVHMDRPRVPPKASRGGC